MDIRLLTTFPKHRKVRRIIKMLGFEGVYSLISLWCYVAENHPKGVLKNYDVIDIEEAANWSGETGKFVKTLTNSKLNLLIKKGNTFVIRNWEKHQSWIIKAPERREKARAAAEKRWSAKSMPEACSEHASSNAKTDTEQCPFPILSLPNHDKHNKPEKPKPAKKSRKKKTQEEIVIELKKLYPQLDVDKEVQKMNGWLNANPRRKFSKKFATNWLNKALDNYVDPDENYPSNEELWEVEKELIEKGLLNEDGSNINPGW